MLLEVRGHDLPGASYADHARVGIALQVGRDPVGVVVGDAAHAHWRIDVRRVAGDLRGPAVHGRRGDRFLYLAWGDLGPPDGGRFTMFRRAKLMLDAVDAALLEQADRPGRMLVADVSLTDERGGPRCARVDPPAVRWSVEEA